MAEWWDYAEEDVEGGVLEFDFRLELHVYQRLDNGEAIAVWMSDDASYVQRVEIGEA